jgi:hypothetical protein
MFNRSSRSNLLIEVNPYQILVAGFSRPASGSLVLNCAAEFESDDDLGLRQWLDENFEKQNAWVPVIGGFVPPEGLLQRESLLPRKLIEPDYLTNLVKEQYKIENTGAWKLSTLSPLEGVPLLPEGTQRPALVCGVSHTNVHQVQQRLLDHRLLPARLEMGLLPLLGVISDYKTRRSDKRAVVVVCIEQEHTVAYILGKEGVHTPAAVRHGFSSIVQAARKEFGLADTAAVRDRLHQADDELLLRATKFVRAIGRDLKPLVDSYEMTTGQPVGEIYCAYLPPGLAWIAEPLAQVVGRTPFSMNCTEWLPTVNLQMDDGMPAFGQHWLGALSLVADLPGPKSDAAQRSDAADQGPWRIDCRLSAQLPSNDLVRRRFVANTIAATLAVAALMFTGWQLYAGYILTNDTTYWEQRVADKKKETDALNLTTRNLTAASDKLDQAYTLMSAPYQLSDLLLSLGRARPASMRIDTINAFDNGLVLRGVINEPSDRAKRTLRQYMDELRRDTTINAAFASIMQTSFERREGVEGFNFELTFKLKGAQP